MGGVLPVLAVTAAGMIAAPQAQTPAVPPLAVDKRLILAEHNRYRAAVGVPPLTWSDQLAQGAQRWANTISLLGKMQHSQAAGIGENLAYWSGRHPSLNAMIAIWEQEKQLFQPGAFPNVSRDGNWLSVSHYTQMVWRKTTQVGCGIGNGGKSDFLVCWYSPRGNYIGQLPY